MRAAPDEQHALTFGDYLRVIRRRAWIIIVATLVLTAAGIGVSMKHQASYTASADVLVNRQNTSSSGTSSSDTTILNTQVGVAGVPIVARRTLAAAHVKSMTADEFLSSASVAAQPGTDLLTFTVKNTSPTLAEIGRAHV